MADSEPRRVADVHRGAVGKRLLVADADGVIHPRSGNRPHADHETPAERACRFAVALGEPPLTAGSA